MCRRPPRWSPSRRCCAKIYGDASSPSTLRGAGGKTIQLATALRDAGADAVVAANEPSSSGWGPRGELLRCGVGPWLRCTRTTGLFAAPPAESADLIRSTRRARATLSRGGKGGPREDPGPARRRLDEGIVATQLEIARAAWPCLRPGGALVCATCSLRPREDEEIAQQVLKERDAALRTRGPPRAATRRCASAADARQRRLLRGEAAQGRRRRRRPRGRRGRGRRRRGAGIPAGRWGVTSLVDRSHHGRGPQRDLCPRGRAAPRKTSGTSARARSSSGPKVRGRAVPLGQALRSAAARDARFADLGGMPTRAARVARPPPALAWGLRGDDVDVAPPSGEPAPCPAHGGRVPGRHALKGGRLKNQPCAVRPAGPRVSGAFLFVVADHRSKTAHTRLRTHALPVGVSRALGARCRCVSRPSRTRARRRVAPPSARRTARSVSPSVARPRGDRRAGREGPECRPVRLGPMREELAAAAHGRRAACPTAPGDVRRSKSSGQLTRV